jgi:hypothetical protein
MVAPVPARRDMASLRPTRSPFAALRETFIATGIGDESRQK